MPKESGTWGFILAVIALVLSVPLSILANIITPKLQDWWATQSMQRLQKQIAALERLLSDPLTSEHTTVRLFKCALIAITLIGYGAALAIFAWLYPASQAKHEALIGVAALLLGFAGSVGLRGVWFARSLRFQKADEYDRTIAERISKLKAKLIMYNSR